MKERPILFSGAMVRALLDGAKTQTRRIVKQQPVVDSVTHNNDRSVWFGCGASGLTDDGWRCPYGVVGDRLWVRETWAPGEWCYPHDKVLYRASVDTSGPEFDRTVHSPWCQSRADRFIPAADCAACADFRWRPSIFMPRWASRITLEVTDVRVQRLQDISEEDARAEGARPGPPSPAPEWWAGKTDRNVWWTARDSMRLLWDSINGEGAWDANPWVWALTFKRVTP